MQKNLNIEKIAFKVVQIKFLAMYIYITNLNKLIYGRKCTKYLHRTCLINTLMIIGMKEKDQKDFDPYSVLLAIVTNIPQQLKTSCGSG